MYKRILFFTITILISTAVYSQKNEIELLKPEKLREQFPDQKAVIVESTIKLTFGYDKTENKVTVTKEMTETFMDIDRVDMAKYVFYDGESKIEKFKINKSNHLHFANDEAYTSDGLFHNDIRVKWAKLNFTKIGDTNTTYIRKKFHDIKYLTSLYFTASYPTIKKTIQIDVPDWLDIEFKEFNFDSYDIVKKITDIKNGKTHTYIIKNVHANYDEPRSPGPTYIYPHLLLLPKSHTKTKNKEIIFENTQDLYNWYKSLVDDLKNTDRPYKNRVNELIKDAGSDEEKAKRIFYWVQDNIRYIAFEDGIAGFKPDEAANVFNKKYGDCKGMANLTKEMLEEAGLDARLTWIGTNRIAYDYSTPSLAVDNHMICTYIKDGVYIYLDATEDYNAYGEYANRIQGKQVLIENEKDFILKKVPTVKSDFNKEIINYNYTLEGNKLIGTASKKFTGETRTYILQYLNTIKNDKKEDFLKAYLNNENSNISVSNIATSDLDNREISIDISYDISVKNRVSSFDGITYIDLDIDKELKGFAFKDRNTDYNFKQKKHLISTTTLKLSDEYKIMSIPKNISLKNDNYDLSIIFSQENNTITYKKVFAIKNAKISVSDLDQWNEFIKKLNVIYNEQIIITKKQ